MTDMTIEALFDLNRTQAGEFISSFVYPWEVLPEIGRWIKEFGKTLPENEYDQIEESVWIAKSVKRYPNTYIAGPAIIGPETEIRPGAFIRGNAFIGSKCVVGNSTELKNVILFDEAKAPHYNYVGDSILGFKSHMGAGSITSNMKQDESNIVIKRNNTLIETGLRKFGAILGDNVEIGCGAVLNPGTVVGSASRVYPLSMVRGFIPGNTIYKNDGTQVTIAR